MHIQKVFVILAFNNQLIETLISLIVKIPVIGDKLEAPVRAGLGELCFIFYNWLYAFLETLLFYSFLILAMKSVLYTQT